ncbi:Virulence factor mviM homolog [uncultured Butyricicoccus sp.]|uniref:Gfo/Idh/MocA family oxidoreductase n=1 Tax=Agathobaculum ammoniilyticum TaxID=2981778 RepID=A0ABT2U2T7_9FIRM|nr:Gfo/Idh/MocA family oxidoreductase [Agathobaculum ammoniilyticum]MCU6788938.1 Gfo/Idh/MocA family oxidoreductase [Agathobaculum ammoniilyticum]SCI97450.1 Virulence factor mviM homolog [uncultured Butyricicoccus sp.]
MAEKKLRVGVIGVGYVSKNNFLPVLPRFDDVEFVGLMAGKLENAQQAQRLCGAQQAVATLEAFVSLGLDCAFVLTPKQCHAEQISFLLEQGIDVYSEKPMATTLKDAARIAEAAAKTGNKLMIGFNRRYAPVCQKAKAVYGEGSPEVIIAQKNRPATEYRATLENAIHMVDLMRYYGGEVKDVNALTKFTDPYYETFTTAQLEFENGASGMLIAARCSGQWEETIELHGNNRSAFIKMPDSVTVTDAEEQHKTAMTPLAMGWAKSEDKLGFTNAIRHFLDCVRDGKTPLTDAADAYKTHELLDRILRAAGLPAMD